MAPSEGSGVDLLEARIAAIPDHARAFLASAWPDLERLPPGQGVVCTGLGSSEAAARYAVALLGRRGRRPVRFAPVSEFYGDPPFDPEGQVLVVFSQGLSPNSRIPLRRRREFARTVLVTSATVEGQRRRGRADRADFLGTFAEEGGMVWRHPPEDEFTILPRVIGPFCALLAAHRLARGLEGSGIPEPPGEPLWRDLPAGGPREAAETDAWAREILEGCDFYFTGGLSGYAGNLACKAMECVLRPPPRSYDVFDYAHGPFQADRAAPRHRWIFAGSSEAEADLLERLLPLFRRAGPCRVLRSVLPAPFEIFGFELLLDRIVARAAVLAEVDLRDWPGKGEDGAAYDLARPFSGGTDP